VKYARLGGTDLTVSQLALGTAPLGGLFGPVDEATATMVVGEALDLGITVIDTSSSYGDAEERLGRALVGRRDEVVLATKAGRVGGAAFDFSPESIRHSLLRSLRRLRTDHVDVFQLHNIEFASLGTLFEDTFAEMLSLREQGVCRYVGMTGYPAAAICRAIRETDLDVALTYAHATLLDDTLQREIVPVAHDHGVGLINAAAVALGLLTPNGPAYAASHPASAPIREAALRMADLCASRGADLAFVANQYSIQRSGCVMTVIGTSKSTHLRSAVAAAETSLDEELLQDLLALRPPLDARTWTSGLPENNISPTQGDGRAG
jgi:aryl-alcohol dehydrogenase-like predicted oxidoreductase